MSFYCFNGLKQNKQKYHPAEKSYFHHPMVSMDSKRNYSKIAFDERKMHFIFRSYVQSTLKIFRSNVQNTLEIFRSSVNISLKYIAQMSS